MAGTLFLDGIDELDLDCQRVLLALLQGREMASGGQMGFRLISTTTRNIDREIGLGRFRRELYFRINGACIKLPPLRERKEDIAVLAEYFLEKHALDAGRRTPILSAEEEELLRTHDWPGNIRELGNLARKIVALGQSRAAMSELRNSGQGNEPGGGSTGEERVVESGCKGSFADRGTGTDSKGAGENALESQTGSERTTGQL